jgi:hypothetical protein
MAKKIAVLHHGKTRPDRINSRLTVDVVADALIDLARLLKDPAKVELVPVSYFYRHDTRDTFLQILAAGSNDKFFPIALMIEAPATDDSLLEVDGGDTEPKV